jgi:hypothetical protein
LMDTATSISPDLPRDDVNMKSVSALLEKQGSLHRLNEEGEA